MNPWVRTSDRWVRVDLLWPDLGIVGEADGQVKYGSDAREGSQTLWLEKLRQEELEHLGLLVLRWTRSEIVSAPLSVVAHWHRLAARRSARPWRPPPSFAVSTGGTGAETGVRGGARSRRRAGRRRRGRTR